MLDVDALLARVGLDQRPAALIAETHAAVGGLTFALEVGPIADGGLVAECWVGTVPS